MGKEYGIQWLNFLSKEKAMRKRTKAGFYRTTDKDSEGTIPKVYLVGEAGRIFRMRSALYFGLSHEFVYVE